MKSKLTAAILGGLCFLTFYSGIIRDGVKEKMYLRLAKQPQFDCVGQVFRNTEPAGSCVLIGDKFVLSAGHVFIEHDFRQDTLKMQGQTIITNVPYNDRVGDISTYFFSFNGKRYQGESLKVFPAYLDSITKGKCDIALIELKELVTNIQPASLCNSFTEFQFNVVGVGFGASGIANKPQTVKLRNKKIA